MTNLPNEIASGAIFDGNEYAWPVSLFPDAIHCAEAVGYACVGGQFQFRSEDGICEMYWLNADSTDRYLEEKWGDYCHRSCSEVLKEFRRTLAGADFHAEAKNWPRLADKVSAGLDPSSLLVFVAYFVQESEAAAFQRVAGKGME